MNLLTVDIGNTDIKFGLFENGRLRNFWRATGVHAQPERFSALLRESLAAVDAHFDVVAYTSVVPAVEIAFRKTLQYCFSLPDKRMFAIDPARVRLPLDFSRYPLSQLGMDRLVNACAARLLYPDTSLIVADFGTATTLDLVSADGVYLGGAIAPGLQTFARILPEHTARLPQVPLEDQTPDTLHMGLDTVSCIQAGLGIGYRGLIKELLKTALREMGGGQVLLIATGGLAEPVIQLCGLEQHFQNVNPRLTLQGLQLLYDFNRAVVKV